MAGRLRSLRSSSWVWLLELLTMAGFVDAAFWSQMVAFNVLSSSATDATRGRVMTFSYLPVNLGYAVGPTLGAIVAGTPAGLLTIFPLAAVVTLTGIGALAVARRQPVGG